jgi:hypothetical protein
MLRRTRFIRLLTILIGFLSFAPSVVSGLEIAPLRYPVGAKAPDAFIPYAASHSLSEPNPRITRILFSIHSSGFDALQYYENAQVATSKVRGALSETLIVAPQFFEQKVIPGAIPDGLLFWTVSPFRGSSRGAVGAAAKSVRISAFDVMDDWLASLTDPLLFPRVKNVVFVGHSGGGQFVQRYAMVGKFEAGENIKCRYVVSAPSSYAYPSGERFDPRRNRFAVPDAQALSACPDYNNWGYGLASPYSYFSDVDTELIAKRYGERYVFYLCGANDTDPNDDTIGKSCGAMMQGRHRLERMQVFVAFLRQKYGPSIMRRHTSAVVPGVGHFGRGNMTSPSGLKFLFTPIR